MVFRITFWTRFVVLLVDLCNRYTETGMEKVCMGMAGCESARRNPEEKIGKMALITRSTINIRQMLKNLVFASAQMAVC